MASRRLWPHGILIIAVGLLAAILLYYLGSHDEPVLAPRIEPRGQERPKTDDLRFQVVLEGLRFKKGTTGSSFADYKSEDGIVVERAVDSYHSSTLAREEMQRMVKRASKLHERSIRRTPDGKPAGERVVLTMPSPRNGGALALVVWTEGPKLYVLESSSLRHVLAFEKQAYPSRDPATEP